MPYVAGSDAIELDREARVLAGLQPVETLDPDADPTAALFERVARTVLAAAPWRFAMRAEQLVEVADTTPPPPYAVLYRRPDRAAEGLVRLWRLTDANGLLVARWEAVGDHIAAEDHVKPGWAWYTAETPTDRWPVNARNALVNLLAAEYCLAVREDPQRADVLRQVGWMLVRTAAATDGATWSAPVRTPLWHEFTRR